MSVRYPLDPFALPDRPDIPLPMEVPEPVGFRRLLRRFFLATGLFAVASLVLSGLLFLPVLISEIGHVDAVIMDGVGMKAAGFASRLSDLFLGTVIISIAVLSFIVSAGLAAADGVAWRVSPPNSEDRHRRKPEPMAGDAGVRETRHV